ncbi:MAG: hypothetical protein RPU15_08740 [Candidatus Sedimenticola sp. (ex Thyasira tokunagai)]
MRNKDDLNSLIERVNSLLSDIEHRKDLETICPRYADLKGYVESEIKSCGKMADSEYVEYIYLPALNEFILRLKPNKGNSKYPMIYDALLDGVGLLEWYKNGQSEI